MCKHRFKWIRQSAVIYQGKLIEIDIYQCLECKKLQIITVEDPKIISLGGRLGEETEF